MQITLTESRQEAQTTLEEQCFRPLYVRRVPEDVWILVHDNANRSRMRLSDYIVELLKGSKPISK